MIKDELIKIWQSSPNQEQVKFEKSRLMMEVQSTLDTLHKAIKYRDMREQLGAAVGIPVFAFYAYHIPYTLTKVASVLIIAWGIYVIYRLQKAKKYKPGSFTETYLQYLYKSREYLRIQKDVLDKSLYWYILPAMAFIFLFILGPGIAGRLPIILAGGLLIGVSGAAFNFLNKRAVNKEFVPRLEKIDELIGVMEGN